MTFGVLLTSVSLVGASMLHLLLTLSFDSTPPEGPNNSLMKAPLLSNLCFYIPYLQDLLPMVELSLDDSSLGRGLSLEPRMG